VLGVITATLCINFKFFPKVLHLQYFSGASLTKIIFIRATDFMVVEMVYASMGFASFVGSIDSNVNRSLKVDLLINPSSGGASKCARSRFGC